MASRISLALVAATLAVVATTRTFAIENGPFRTADLQSNSAADALRPAVITGDNGGAEITLVRYGRWGAYYRPYYAYRPYYRPYAYRPYYGYRPYRVYPYYGGYYPGRVDYGWRGYPGVYRW